MMTFRRSVASFAVSALVALGASAGTARAVVVHSEDAAGPDATLRPDEAVVGAFNGSSAVAIGPNHFVASVHQGGSVGSSITFGGTTYTVADLAVHPTADLVVGRVTASGGGPAELSAFTPIYSATDELTQAVTIGGRGRGTNTALVGTFGRYGYAWDAPAALRWGRNRIDAAATAAQADPQDPWPSVVLLADFDDRGALTSVDFEAAMAQFDSGGGWFVQSGGTWYVAGLARGVERADESRFEDPTTGLPDPDIQSAVRLSSYAGFIAANVPEPGAMFLLCGAATIGLSRRRHRRG